MTKTIDETVTQIFNERVANSKHGWIANAEANLAALKDDAFLSDRFGSWDGEKCLVVGAGPSLMNDLSTIGLLQEQGWRVITVDRAHAKLKQRGTTPDITITCDASPAVKDMLELVDASDTVALTPRTHPEVVAHVKSRTENVLLYDGVVDTGNSYLEWATENYDERTFSLVSMYTVGFFATDLAVKMDCMNVAFTGMDLSYHRETDVPEDFKICIQKNHAADIYTIPAFYGTAMGIIHLTVSYPEIIWWDSSNGLLDCSNVMEIPLSNLLEREPVTT